MMKIADKLYVALRSQYDKFYDLFISTTPKTVDVEDIDNEGNLVTKSIPNLASSKKKVDDFIANGKAVQTGMKNYLLDPFGLDYTEIDEKKIPNSGFLPEYGVMKIECVSPLWRGAQAVEGEPEGSTTDFTVANPDNPLSGTYGKVFGRGGIGSGWGSNKSNGHIFKLTAPKVEDENQSAWLNLSNKDLKEFAQVGREPIKCRFRAWVYIEKGKLAFGSHAGYKGNISGKYVVDTIKEWIFVDVSFSYITGNPFYRGFNIGTDPYLEELEAYMVAPLLTVSTGNTSYIA